MSIISIYRFYDLHYVYVYIVSCVLLIQCDSEYTYPNTFHIKFKKKNIKVFYDVHIYKYFFLQKKLRCIQICISLVCIQFYEK